MGDAVVVAGAAGFVGRNLVPVLRALGREVRCGTRDPERARRAAPDLHWVELDVDREASLERALRGADALVYLVHQMRAGSADLAQREAESALRTRNAAEHAGIRRLVYLGGPAPTETRSHHLEARLKTGKILRSGTVSTIELRASMIVGEGSESWLIVRDLALRLPVMVLPRWLGHRTQPIGIDDVVTALVRAIDHRRTDSAWYDLPGPEVLSGRQILERVAAQIGLRPLMLPVPVLTPSLSSHWIRLVTRADYGVARQLVDGLVVDLLADGSGFWSEMPDLHPTPFDVAVRAALADEPLDRPGVRWEGWVRRLAVGPLRA